MLIAGDEGKIVVVFYAKQANIVAGSTTSSEVSLRVDGGAEQKMQVMNEDLYTVAAADDYSQHVLEIVVKGKDFRLYTFTFG